MKRLLQKENTLSTKSKKLPSRSLHALFKSVIWRADVTTQQPLENVNLECYFLRCDADNSGDIYLFASDRPELEN